MSAALDKRLARRAFELAAAGYDQAAVLQREVCGRMLERLQYVKYEPRAILDAGCGTGFGMAKLMARYPRARLVGLDIARNMLLRARGPWWRRMIPGARACYVCADLERLPLKSSSMGLVWSNLTLQWCNDLGAAFHEAWRVLEPGGLFMFSTFGPDTLKELKRAFQTLDAHVHVHSFIDMHDIGDELVRHGLGDPVMDMEVITLTYASVAGLARDLKAIGAQNVARGRRPGLMAKSAWRQVEHAYEQFRSAGKLPATFEIVYGHAWKAQAGLGAKTGPQVIAVHRKQIP